MSLILQVTTQRSFNNEHNRTVFAQFVHEALSVFDETQMVRVEFQE